MSEFKDHVKTILEKYTDSKEAVNQITLEILNPFGGSNVYISIPFEERNQHIVQLYKQGVTANKLAREFCLTERNVYKIVKNFR